MLHHNGVTRRQTLEDDLESLVYVVLYCAFLWLPHDAAQDTIASTMAMFFEFSLPWANGVPFGGIGKVSNSVFRGYTGPIQFSPALRHWIDAVLDCIWPPKPDLLALPPSGTVKKHEYMENLPGMESQQPRMNRPKVPWTSDEETTDGSDEGEDPLKRLKDGAPKKTSGDEEPSEPVEDEEAAVGLEEREMTSAVEAHRKTSWTGDEPDVRWLQETSLSKESMKTARTEDRNRTGQRNETMGSEQPQEIAKLEGPPETMEAKQPEAVEVVEQPMVDEQPVLDSQDVPHALATKLGNFWAEFLQTYPLDRDDRVVHDDPHATGEWYRKRSLRDTEDGTSPYLQDESEPKHKRSRSQFLVGQVHPQPHADPSSPRPEASVPYVSVQRGGSRDRSKQGQSSRAPRGIWRSKQPSQARPTLVRK